MICFRNPDWEVCCTLDVVCIELNGDTWKLTHMSRRVQRVKPEMRWMHVDCTCQLRQKTAQIDRHYHVMHIFTKNSSLDVYFCTASNVCIKSFSPQKGKRMHCATDAKVSFWYTLHITHYALKPLQPSKAGRKDEEWGDAGREKYIKNLGIDCQ